MTADSSVQQPQIIEGAVDLEGKGRGWSRVVDPTELCPACGYAMGAHNPYCPDEAESVAWWGR